MIPDISILQENLNEFEYGDETFKIQLSEDNDDYIKGKVDDLKSVEQAIYLILNTERYAHNIYSWNYGVELVDLIGQPLPYVTVVLPNRIEEALLQDDRIIDVQDFNFKKFKDTLLVTFIVMTNVGEIQSELEVVI